MAKVTITLTLEGEDITTQQVFDFLKTLSDARLPKNIFDAPFWATHELLSKGIVASAKPEELSSILLDELKREEETTPVRRTIGAITEITQ